MLPKREGDVKIKFKSIGIIHTPYVDYAPYQPVENDGGNLVYSKE